MILRRIAVAAAALFLLGAGGASAQVPGAIPTDRLAERAEIMAGERAWGEAYVTGDVATVERLLTDDFIGVDTHGNAYDKARVIADARALPHSTSDLVDHFAIRFHGEFAVVRALEHGVGPSPERKPREAVFTDSWVRENGRWRIVAAQDFNRGLRTPSLYSPDEAAIRDARAASNRAIAAHDVAALTPFFTDDAVFVWSNGTSAVGKAAMAKFFAEDFANPATITFIRTPDRVAVSASGTRAYEQGTWTALKNCLRYGGDYSAHWVKVPEGWRIRGELYVKLHCTGVKCTP
jgi:ketosteroid isomerase-like protein